MAYAQLRQSIVESIQTVFSGPIFDGEARSQNFDWLEQGGITDPDIVGLTVEKFSESEFGIASPPSHFLLHLDYQSSQSGTHAEVSSRITDALGAMKAALVATAGSVYSVLPGGQFGCESSIPTNLASLKSHEGVWTGRLTLTILDLTHLA